MAVRNKLPVEIIRVFETALALTCIHHQNPHIAPAKSPTLRNNCTSNYAKVERGLYAYL
jgi:hypothetical protein